MSRATTICLGLLAAVLLTPLTPVVAEAAGMATTPQEAKPFVQETRPTDMAYVPVGSVVTREAARKPVADFKTMEAELEAKRISNEAAGTQAKALGATPPPAPATLPTN